MEMSTSVAVYKHSRATRMAHMGLALAVVVQLVTSLVMQPPAPDSAGNWYFEVHEYSGLAAFCFVFGFWAVLGIRRKGTAPGALFPWFSGARRIALRKDTRAHIAAMMSRRLPPYDDRAALPSAVHGLGLLLMTAMAVSGATYYFINTGDPDAGGAVGAIMFAHKSLANIVWAYLIGHAGLALVHHYAQHMSLREIWSVNRDNTQKGNKS